ncbi:MAG: hypothetical protein EBS05_10085 [Proteobacteria bacterium]|nr:hypothetical protein [Pseudomonadota bacterium]
MDATFNVKLAGMDKAVEEAMLVTKKTVAEQINQTTFNVAARGFHYTTPNTWNDSSAIARQRWKVQSYLKEPAGPEGANRFGSRHKRGSRMLRRVTLIAQALFYRKHGYGIGKGKSNKRTRRASTVKGAKPGKMVYASDYGQAMTAYAGTMLRRNSANVGYLKTVWMAGIDALAPLVKFKGYLKNFSGLAGLRRQLGSSSGSATPASDGSLRARVSGLLSSRKLTDKSQQIIDAAARQAMADEEKELRRHTEEQLKKAFQKLTR